MRNPEALARIRARSKLLRSAREFFIRRGFCEVQTAVLGTYPANEAHLQPLFATASGVVEAGPSKKAEHPRWLHTSPESSMKRILARTEQDIFQICPVFRAHESGSRHREEFTMLEWYRVGYGWQQLLEESLALLKKCRLSCDRVNRMSWLEWVEGHFGANLLELGIDELRALAAKRGLEGEANRQQLLDFLFDSSLPGTSEEAELNVITHYPRESAVYALAGPERAWSTRFEIFFGALELVNGCEEVNSQAEQRLRFAEQNRTLRDSGQSEREPDEAWLAEINQMPKCAGAALGIERLLMAVHGLTDINQTDSLAIPIAEDLSG